mmetsp:Transcript_7817/g.17480  ORF Transcript_7817/g.17480 Transcript_7817/m.17480 type:complete len:264 (+) Transcript_7817:591-1382(+)
MEFERPFFSPAADGLTPWTSAAPPPPLPWAETKTEERGRFASLAAAIGALVAAVLPTTAAAAAAAAAAGGAGEEGAAEARGVEEVLAVLLSPLLRTVKTIGSWDLALASSFLKSSLFFTGFPFTAMISSPCRQPNSAAFGSSKPVTTRPSMRNRTPSLPPKSFGTVTSACSAGVPGDMGMMLPWSPSSSCTAHIIVVDFDAKEGRRGLPIVVDELGAAVALLKFGAGAALPGAGAVDEEEGETSLKKLPGSRPGLPGIGRAAN